MAHDPNFPQGALAAPRPARAGLVPLLLTCLAGAALIALSSRIQVPMWPVPATLQSLAVLGLAMGLGRLRAGGAVLLWLAYGTFGVPVFASGGGLAYLTGPTAGYLAGFLIAALVIGTLADRGAGRGFAGALGLALLGGGLIYAAGMGWLAVFTGVEAAFRAGVLPFLPGDLVKSLLLALALPQLLRWAVSLR